MPIAGKIAYMTEMMLNQGSGGRLIEPIKKNQYRLLLQVTSLIEMLKNQFKEDEDYLEAVKTSMVGNLYPIEISFTPPALQVEERKIKGKGNMEVKYGGYITYSNAEASFHNFIGLDTFKFFHRWASITGALYLQRNNDEIKNDLPGQALGGGFVQSFPLALPNLSDTASGGYKVNGTVSTFHTNDTAVGDETEDVRWILEGVFPTSVAIDAFNHSDDGDAVLTNVSFSVDLALPATATVNR
jgi:hypothetical protein